MLKGKSPPLVVAGFLNKRGEGLRRTSALKLSAILHSQRDDRVNVWSGDGERKPYAPAITLRLVIKYASEVTRFYPARGVLID